jgi:GH43 family beta-xylosidase
MSSRQLPVNPLITQRADPFIVRHTDGYYYFTASVPEYDRLELRRARTLAGLAEATPVDIWRKPASGPLSELIWAPEIHYIAGAWYIYFAAAPSREIKHALFQHRIFVATTAAANPLDGPWEIMGRVDTGWDSFSLDATSFQFHGRQYLVWAQQHPSIMGNSNLFIAAMSNPQALASRAVMLSQPEFAWETQGFAVNEGPAVLVRGERVFLSYSASATDARYCMGLLHASTSSDLLVPGSWSKSRRPTFTTYEPRDVYGPGHNSFTVSESGDQDILVYHARNYREIAGDPLWNPDRHTCVQSIEWDEQGMPVFGLPIR